MDHQTSNAEKSPGDAMVDTAAVPGDAAPTSSVDPIAVDEDDGLDGPIISFAGKDAIKDAWERIMETSPTEENAIKFVRRFRERHRLHHKDIDEVVNLLEAAGISRNQLAKEIMANMVNIIRQKIVGLTQPQLSKLLDRSYTYLTVPELAPIAISTLEHLKFVKPTVWTQIVQNGLEESPYTDLPLSIKHRIWVQETEAFDHEIDVVLSAVVEPPPPTMAELEKNATIEVRKSRSTVLADLLRLVQGLSDDLLLQTAEKLYSKARDETTPLRRIAIANLFHDFATHAPIRSPNHTLVDARKCAKFLSTPSNSALSADDIRFVYDAIVTATSRSYVTLLACSSISRDVLVDQLVNRLINFIGPAPLDANGEPTPQIQEQLKADVRLIHLTCLLLYNIKSSSVLGGADVVLPEEVDVPFEAFYPVMFSEIQNDAAWRKDGYFLSNAKMPNPNLMQMATQGRLERRVIATYCLNQHMQSDIVGLSRFRLLLDSIVATCDTKEEAREFLIAQVLSRKVSEF